MKLEKFYDAIETQQQASKLMESNAVTKQVMNAAGLMDSKRAGAILKSIQRLMKFATGTVDCRVYLEDGQYYLAIKKKQLGNMTGDELMKKLKVEVLDQDKFVEIVL